MKTMTAVEEKISRSIEKQLVSTVTDSISVYDRKNFVRI